MPCEYYLSFDCANRSLAVCLVSIADIKTPCTTSTILYAKVFDLTQGKKLATSERTVLLKGCLTDVDVAVNALIEMHPKVLIEYQMSINDKSRCVSNQVLYHYSGRFNDCNSVGVHLVGPSLKNKVCFSGDEKYLHSTFMGMYASSYTANKKHTSANLMYWLKKNDQLYIVKNIKKKNLDDIADAFVQIYGHIMYKK